MEELQLLTTERGGWPHTLLRQSTLALVQELVAAGVQTANGILTGSSFENLKSQVREQILKDPGLGTMAARGPLLVQMPRSSDEFAPASFKHKAWISALPGLRTEYLQGWKTEFGNPAYGDASAPAFVGAIPAREAAGLLVAHMLDLGFSSSYLSRWFNYLAVHDTSSYTLSGIIDKLEDRSKNARGRAQILLILARPPQDYIRSLHGWMDGGAVTRWLADNNLHGPRSIHGGLLYESQQWDLDGALLNVARAAHRLKQRTNLKTGRAPEFYSTAWIVGVKDPRRLPPISQLGRTTMPGYELGDLRVEASGSDDRLEVAVELLVSALSEPGPSAAGTLWASLEALLAAPGDPDRIQVAQRAGDIALVALIRASIQISLGMLFSRCPEDGLSRRLLGLDLQDRLLEFEAALRRDEHGTLAHSRTRLVLAHTRILFDADALRSKRQELQQTLLHLYRQRNLVLHGGVTDAPLLGGVLRASTPIVIAVINRYARATQDGAIDPHVFAFQMFTRLEGYLNEPSAIVKNIW